MSQSRAHKLISQRFDNNLGFTWDDASQAVVTDLVALLREVYDYLPPASGIDGQYKKQFRKLVARIDKVLGK